MFDTNYSMKVSDFDIQRVKTMFDTSAGRNLPSSKVATIKFDTTPRAFRSHVTGCYRPKAACRPACSLANFLFKEHAMESVLHATRYFDIA
jgi:hypothetical protein